MFLIRVGEQFVNLDYLIKAKIAHDRNGHGLVLSLLFATPQDEGFKPCILELLGRDAKEMITLLDSMAKGRI